MKSFLTPLVAFIFLMALGCTHSKNTSENFAPVEVRASQPESQKANPESSPSLLQGLAPSKKGDVIAQLNGQPITEKEVMDRIKSRIAKIENQVYEIKRDAIDQIITERLMDAEAKKRNLSVDKLLKLEVEDKVGEVSDKEAEDFYNAHKDRFNGKSFDEVKAPLTRQLKFKRANEYQSNFINKLMSKAEIDVYIDRPRVEVAAGNGPSKGPAKAPITLVEFTDYQCPYCGKARDTVNEIVDLYKKDVRYSVRNFPLSSHNNAKKAAVAALCANEQGKYWQYSKKLWANQGALEVDNLKKFAHEEGLDTGKFNTCLDSNKYDSEITQDTQEGMKAGVTGTPAFFINGQMLSGAMPPETFKKIIDQELRDAKKKKG